MTWIKLRADFCDHRKIGRLSRALDLPRALVRGYLVSIWTRALIEAPDGELDGWDPEDVAEACGATEVSDWDLAPVATDPNKLVEALISAGCLHETPDGYRIHDWSDHCGLELERRNRAKERDRKRSQRAERASHGVPGTSRNVPGTSGDTTGRPGMSTPERERERENTEDSLRSSSPRSPSPGGEVSAVEAVVEEPVALDDWPCLPGRRDGPRRWRLTEAHATELAEAYPAVDVLAEARRCRQWLRDNPRKLKTHGGMRRFVGAWMARQQDRGGPPGPGGGRPMTTQERLAARAAESMRAAQAHATGGTVDERGAPGTLGPPGWSGPSESNLRLVSGGDG